MKDLNSKVVVITGAGSGIGRSLATLCARRGARLALCDVDDDGLAQTRAACGDTTVFTAHVDVADRRAMDAFRDQVVEHYARVDLVVNNAGVAHSQTISDTEYDDFEWIMGINFWGVVHGTKTFLPLLQENTGSALINVSSVFGIISVPTQGTYNATKFAVRGFTEALRHETAGSGLHVMCVHPGGIKTAIAHSARFYVGPDGSSDQSKSAGDFVDKLARTTPDQAARKILDDLGKKKGRCLIGVDAKIISVISRLIPVNYWKVMSRLMPG
ncbi:SDR family NAD(P)-dependent oxidoreductase [Salinisphaera aquimarina]|uniref:SDR family NAD(P)-dependent oxidoreductase n=1 Tax=Salinisphaera aquimarina TaxID=2094031 RepID=A0ABV7ELK7_9GAMM